MQSIKLAHKMMREKHLQQQVLFALVEDIERGLCSRCSLKVFFDARGASFCFAKTENYAEDLCHVRTKNNARATLKVSCRVTQALRPTASLRQIRERFPSLQNKDAPLDFFDTRE